MPRGRVVQVRQGEVAATAEPADELRALLGSCVAICLYDATTGIGGMTHTVHADLSRLGEAVPLNDYERLYNGVVKLGASRVALRATVVGGAHVTTTRKSVGVDLGRFILRVLERERVPVDRSEIGGVRARRVRFTPGVGRLVIAEVPDLVDEHAPSRRQPSLDTRIELF